MSPQYGELRSTSGWDRFTSLGHPCKFQPLSRLGSVTAPQSSSERQPNFAALNRGRHLCSEGRPSRWALAHISSLYKFKCYVWKWTTFANVSIWQSCDQEHTGIFWFTARNRPVFWATLYIQCFAADNPCRALIDINETLFSASYYSIRP